MFLVRLKKFAINNIYVIIILLLSLATFTWFKGDYIFNGDFGFFDVTQSFYKNFFRWDIYNSSGVFNSQDFLFNFGYMLPFKILGFIFSFSASEKIMFYLWIASAGLGVYYLCRVIELSKISSFFAGCLYIFNVYSLMYIFTFGSGGVPIIYVFLPFIFALIIKGIKEKRGFVYATVINLIILFGFGVAYVNPVYVIVIFCVASLYLLYSIFFCSIDKKESLVKIKFFISYLFIFLVINLFWLVPFLQESFSTVKNLFLYSSGETSAIEKIIRVSYNPSGLFNLLGFWALHATFRGNPYYSYGDYYNQPSIVIISYLLPIIVFSAIFFIRRKNLKSKDALFWYILTLLCLFLVGAAKMSGAISDIFLNIMGMSQFISGGFRNIATKIGPILILGYSILFGFSAYSLANIFKNRTLKYAFYSTLFVLVIIILPLPLWQGKQLTDINNYFPSSNVKIPDYCWDLKNRISSQKIDYRMSTLPVIKYYNTNLKWEYGYGAANFYSAIFNKPALSKNIGQSYATILKIGELINDSNFSDINLKLLSLYNAKYSIYFGDTYWDLVAGNNEVLPENKKIIESYYASNIHDGSLVEEQFGKLGLFDINKKYFLPHFYTSKKNIVSLGDLKNLPSIVSRDDYQIRSTIFFKEQNEGKDEILDNLNGKVNGNQEVEFKKVNPTKYRIIIHGASGKFPLVFSESFHNGWKMYLTSPQSPPLKVEGDLGNYKILDGNEEDQASEDELADYISKGWITTLGDGKEKEINHTKWVDNKEKFDYAERYNIDFISKNFQGTIQNDNLPSGHFWETWLASRSGENKSGFLGFARNDKVVQIPDEDHLMANGYANSWVIDVDKLCSENPNSCRKNPDGTFDLETVVEFWPQRLFYIGLGISGLTLVCCIGYLGYDFIKRRRNKVSEIKPKS